MDVGANIDGGLASPRLPVADLRSTVHCCACCPCANHFQTKKIVMFAAILIHHTNHDAVSPAFEIGRKACSPDM